MIRIFKKIKMAPISLLILMLLGCAHIDGPGNGTQPASGAALSGDSYSAEIARLNQVVDRNSKSEQTKKAHLALARLYVDQGNSRRNYHKALEHLRAYASLEDFAPDKETRNWIAVLEEIDRLSTENAARKGQLMQIQNDLEKLEKEGLSLKRTNRKLTQEEIKLRDKNRKLEASNQKLQQTIEMLKRLDRRLEEKRRNFNN